MKAKQIKNLGFGRYWFFLYHLTMKLNNFFKISDEKRLEVH